MYIQEDQLHTVLSPKKGCQRGLEQYIVGQHNGDKQIYMGGKKPGFRFMNNPIYRVGKEGDPSPNEGYSSREQWQPKILTESALHSLYPPIDSGSVYLTEKPWDMRWYYQRDNIPNVQYAEDTIYDNATDMAAYNEIAERRRLGEKLNSWNNRGSVIYDEQNISSERAENDVYNNQRVFTDVSEDKLKGVALQSGTAPLIPTTPPVYSGVRTDVAASQPTPLPTDVVLPVAQHIPNVTSLNRHIRTMGRPQFKDGDPNPAVIPFIDEEKGGMDAPRRVENFMHPHTMNRKPSRYFEDGISPLGYPQPSEYATMGFNENEYNIYPKPLINLSLTREYYGGNDVDNTYYHSIIGFVILAILIGVIYMTVRKK